MKSEEYKSKVRLLSDKASQQGNSYPKSSNESDYSAQIKAQNANSSQSEFVEAEHLRPKSRDESDLLQPDHEEEKKQASDSEASHSKQ